jgi:hypothetical protein
MVLARAKELALISGHKADHTTKEDYAQAKRELSGDFGPDAKEALLESVPEEERASMDVIPDKSPAPLAEGEDDDDGRNESAQLYEEGVAEAGHDQMLQAASEDAEASARIKHSKP